jgi:hypothetical protein
MSINDELKVAEAGVAVASTSAKISTVISNRPGPLPLSGTFTSQGGALLILVSGSGKRRSNVLPGIIGMDVRLDDKEIGKCQAFGDAEGKRGTFVPVFITVSGVSPGRHDVVLHPFSRTETDDNDFFNVTIVEYETPKDEL